MNQKMFKYLLIVLFFIGTDISLNAQKIKTVVIDPGHGGKDPGAVGKFSKEKDIVLPISLSFGKQIEQHFKDIKVIYTRTDDKHLELFTRADIANKNNADLFISIHINSVNANVKAYGTETWVMGHSKSAANLQVAKMENAAILKEANYQENYEGFDPNDPENHIIFSLYQNANLAQSLLFAQYMQEHFKKSNRYDRGVKQAGFLVLWKTTMPSALVELGFISNPEEEKYMNTNEGQDELTTALFQAFVKYKEHYEGEPSNIIFEPKENEKPVEVDKENNSTDKPVNNVENDNNKEIYKDKIVYKIQIHTSSTELKVMPENFKLYDNIQLYRHNDTYKYTIGEEIDYDKIKELYNKVKVDFPGSFIISFKNGERI